MNCAGKKARMEKAMVESATVEKAVVERTCTEESHFIGIDLHKKFMQVAIIQSDDTVLQNEKIECDFDIVRKEFVKFSENAKYGLESSSVRLLDV